MEIQIKNNILTLLPQKAIWWENKKTLLISDLHLGKITHFRNAGIPVPQQAMQNNFTRMDELMEKFAPQKVIFLGDLFHSIVNDEWIMFCEWRKKYESTEMHLVMGNHDKLLTGHLENACLDVHKKELRSGPFLFSHHPKENIKEDDYVISGHIHPVFKLTGIANQSMRFPCFYFGHSQALMPSFGYFTGGYEIKPEDDSKVVIVADGQLKLAN